MDDKATIRNAETGRGKRIGIMILALVAVILVIGVVVRGFRGRHIRQNAAAMTAPIVPDTSRTPPPSPTVPSH